VRPSVLLVTDLSYPARGRRYCDEDIHLSARLRETFDVALCHPRDAVALMDRFDLVLVRNSGPVIGYREEYRAFRAHALATRARVFSELTGKADMVGKQYLVDLYRAGFPVIPTVDRVADLDRLPVCETYVVKPKYGADSVGMRFLGRAEVRGVDDGETLIQPRVDFRHEVSFYFVDDDFQYALYAPDPERRWELKPYAATAADLEFARRFIDWNTVRHGIQRVDACRTEDGDLLLVELEDLNPYLSLDILDQRTRDAVVDSIESSVHAMLRAEAHR